MKKSIIVAGMPRAGSTWLYYNFVNHPGVAMPKFKETFFFGSNYSRGFDWYYGLYGEDVGQKVAFDISPNYYCDETFFEKVAQFGVEHKVVLVLREPAEWLVSLYSQLKSFTPNMPAIDQFLEQIRIDFDGGFYVIKPNEFQFEGVVEQFESQFRGRLLLVNFEEIKRDPIRVLNAIERFAGLDTYFTEETAHIKPVNVSIPKFNIIAYLSTKHLIRGMVVRFVPEFIQKKLIDYLYKVNRQSDKDMSEVARLEGRFRPVYAEKYFASDNVVSL